MVDRSTGLLLATFAVAIVAGLVRFTFGLITIGATVSLGFVWAAATTFLLWSASRQGATRKGLVIAGIVAMIAVSLPVPLSPYGHEKTQLVNRLDLPGAVRFEARPAHGPNICFDDCPSVEAWYTVPSSAADTTADRFTEALRDDGWHALPKSGRCDAASCRVSFRRTVVNDEIYLSLSLGEEALEVQPSDGRSTTPWPEGLPVYLYLS